MNNNYYKKYQKYKKKYLNAKEMKGGLIAEKTICNGPNLYNPNECLKNDFPCVTPDLSCSNIQDSQSNGKIRSITVGIENFSEIKNNIEERKYGLPPPDINCKGQNIFNNIECPDPEYPCVTPTLRCAKLENSETDFRGVNDVATSLILKREDINEELIKNQIFNSIDKERYRIRLYSNNDFASNNLFKIDDFIACGTFACVYKLKNQFDQPINSVIRISDDIASERIGLHNQYKLNSCPFINKVYSYGIYQIEEFNNSTNFYQITYDKPEPLNCMKEGQVLNGCKERKRVGLYSILEPCLGGELFDKIVETDTYNNEKVIKDVMKNIFIGIKCMHDNNIVHKDLKPENIALVNNHDPSNINIVDFGLSVNLDEITQLGSGGSPDYSPVEILKNNPRLVRKRGKPIDIFSAGVILFVLLFKTHIREDSFADPMVYLRFRFSQSRRKYLLNIRKNNIFENYNIPINAKWLENEVDKYFKFGSKNIIDILHLCVQNNPDSRPTVEQVLEHPWFN
tara:strand:+ start:337 stop:1872 length:1536 start_codon:yes stop_codon:yes gene_type:complete